MRITFLTIVGLLFSANLTGQIANPGFESWDTTFQALYGPDLTNYYGVPNPATGYVTSWEKGNYYGICRTTDAAHGTYAIIVHNWYSYMKQVIAYNDTISFKPGFLNGMYKYIGTSLGGTLPKGICRIHLKDQSGDTLGEATHYFDTTAFYTPFTVPIKYRNNNAPDSIFIAFKSAEQACPWGPNPVCNLLYLDSLSLSSQLVTGEKARPGLLRHRLFPNPANGIVFVKGVNAGVELKLFDLHGKLLLQAYSDSIDLSQFEDGVYMLQVFVDKTGVSETYKVLKY